MGISSERVLHMKSVLSLMYDADLHARGLRNESTSSDRYLVGPLLPLQIGRREGKTENTLWILGRP